MTENKDGEKVINLYGVESQLYEIIKNYYNEMGVRVTNQ
jgi:flavoprotein